MEREFTVIIEQDPESGWLVGEVTEPQNRIWTCSLSYRPLPQS